MWLITKAKSEVRNSLVVVSVRDLAVDSNTKQECLLNKAIYFQ